MSTTRQAPPPPAIGKPVAKAAGKPTPKPRKTMVAVASLNEDKLAGVREAFVAMGLEAEVYGREQPSGESNCPDGKETFRGAEYRIACIEKLSPKADYWIAIEAGVFNFGDRHFLIEVIIVRSFGGHSVTLMTPAIPIPAEIIRSAIPAGEQWDKWAANPPEMLARLCGTTDAVQAMTGALTRSKLIACTIGIAMPSLIVQIEAAAESDMEEKGNG